MVQAAIRRRNFLYGSAAAASAVAAVANQTEQALAQAKSGSAAGRMKVGLYSITFLGLWYRGAGAVAGGSGQAGQAVRLRRHGDRRQAAARQPAGLAQAAVPGASRRWPTGRGSRSTPSPPTTTSAARSPSTARAQIAYVRDLIRMAADLGAKTRADVPGLARRDEAPAVGPLRHRPAPLEGDRTRRSPRRRPGPGAARG